MELARTLETLISTLFPSSWNSNFAVLGLLSLFGLSKWNTSANERPRILLRLSEFGLMLFSIHLVVHVFKSADLIFSSLGLRTVLPHLVIQIPRTSDSVPSVTYNIIAATTLFLLYILVWDFWQYWLHRFMHLGLPYAYLHHFHHSATMNILTSFRHSIPEYFFVFFSFNIPFSVLLSFSYPQVNMYFFYTFFTTVSLALHTRLWIPFRWLGYFLMLPNHHLLHHALDTKFFGSNYGNIITLWDRLFGTYTDPWQLSKSERDNIRTGGAISARGESMGFLGARDSSGVR